MVRTLCRPTPAQDTNTRGNQHEDSEMVSKGARLTQETGTENSVSRQASALTLLASSMAHMMTGRQLNCVSTYLAVASRRST